MLTTTRKLIFKNFKLISIMLACGSLVACSGGDNATEESSSESSFSAESSSVLASETSITIDLTAGNAGGVYSNLDNLFVLVATDKARVQGCRAQLADARAEVVDGIVSISNLLPGTTYHLGICESFGGETSLNAVITITTASGPCEGGTRLANLPFANSGEAGIDGLSAETAYLICTPAQWNEISRNTNANGQVAGHYKVMADLDFKNSSPAPINNFVGHLDGNTKSLRNLVMNQGVFRTVRDNAHIEQLKIENASLTITGSATFYGIGILADQIVNAPNTVVREIAIENSRIDNDITWRNGLGSGQLLRGIGGLVGEVYGATIEDVHTDVDIELSTFNNGIDSVGGIVGNASGIVRRAWARGLLQVQSGGGASSQSFYISGLVGQCNGAWKSISAQYGTCEDLVYAGPSVEGFQKFGFSTFGYISLTLTQNNGPTTQRITVWDQALCINPLAACQSFMHTPASTAVLTNASSSIYDNWDMGNTWVGTEDLPRLAWEE